VSDDTYLPQLIIPHVSQVLVMWWSADSQTQFSKQL